MPAPAAGGGSPLEASYAQVCAGIPSLMFRSLLQQQTFPMSLEGDFLTIGCTSEAHLNTLKKPDKFTQLQRTVDKVFGRSIRIDVVLNKNKPASALPVAAPPKPAALLSMEQPVMQAAPQPQSASTDAPFAAVEPSPAQSKAESAPVGGNAGGSSLLEAMAMMEDDGPPDLPPLDDDEDDDEPPFDLDDEDESAPSGNVAAPSLAAVASFAGEPGSDVDLSEAKKHAVELLQGRILD